MEKIFVYHDVTNFLSERMRRTASYVTKGNRVADVGCDHAYTSIYLAQKKVAPHVIAMDINAGPLSRAERNVSLFGEQERIELRLSDGLAALQPGEADTVLIGGMGGPLMIEILERYPETMAEVKELVLQPQSEIPEVRRYLHGKGFCIIDEEMLVEEEKYYTILHAERGKEPAWTDVEYSYGKYILMDRSPVLCEFLEKEFAMTERLISDLSNAKTEKTERRVLELMEQRKRNRLAMELIGR